MKAVILAAGKSTRTYPLTLTLPKPLLRAGGTTLIEHNLTQLSGLVDEAILIVGYKKEMLRKHLGKNFRGIKLTYVEQKEQLGTGHALRLARPHLDGKFIVLMGDDLYGRRDLERCVKHELSVLAQRVDDPSNFGVFVEKGGKILDLVEKPKTFVSNLANTGCYVFDLRVFEEIAKLKKSARGEFELTDALRAVAGKEDVFAVEGDKWMPIVYPWSLLEADATLRGKDVLLGEGTSVTGKVKASTIGKKCSIAGSVERCILGDNVKICKGSILQDCVIGDKVTFSGEARSGKATIEINEKKIEGTFGSFFGDGCVLEKVEVKPGTLVWPKVKKKNCVLEGKVE
ncbi:MAG: sugar phosphate nucleotidyltransferase [Nanoarchaeota archaeon]|nr:sugar phosphate nucleotidyltransferase [Nanoarchaeota archaeon]